MNRQSSDSMPNMTLSSRTSPFTAISRSSCMTQTYSSSPSNSNHSFVGRTVQIPHFSRASAFSTAGGQKRRCNFPRITSVELEEPTHINESVRRKCTSEPDVGQITGDVLGGCEGRRLPTRAGSLGSGVANARFPLQSSLSGYSPSSKHNSLLTKLHIAQRSTSSKVVKKTLLDLKDACSSSTSNEDTASSSSSVPPERECALLAELAVDAYYKVVIAKNQGATIICSALKCYPDNASIQLSCRTALNFLTEKSCDSSSSVVRNTKDESKTSEFETPIAMINF